MSQEDIEIITDIANQAGIIIENAQLYTQARIRANTDELTGLYNHRHFHERIDQEITRDSRFGGTFSLIMMDVDLFKSYNDIYGHLAGDKMLRKIGEYIQKSIRRIDMAFRYWRRRDSLLYYLKPILMPPTRLLNASEKQLNLKQAPEQCLLPLASV